jgi:type II secretory pathway pseudopilin PulG
MSRLIREESGFTLAELMLVAVLMIVVMGATLAALTSVESVSATNQRQNENQEQVRRSVDGLSRELRNLASPTDELPNAIERATASDLIFQSVARTKPAPSDNERNIQRVRYCLDASSKTVWRQEQRWILDTPPSMPPAAECPATPLPGGWDSKAVAAENVVNGTRPVFAYNATELGAITEISTSLFADATPGRPPGEVELETSVFLRNQNRAPTARFTAAVSGLAILLNGSQSEDPEQKALEYYWYDDTNTSPCAPAPPPEVPQVGCVGEGIVFSYAPPPLQLGPKEVYLVVRDPAGLTHTAPTQAVCLIGVLPLCL